MPNESSLDGLARKVVLAVVEREPTVQGSQLGQALKDAGLRDDVRVRYGTLNRFLQDECKDLLVWETKNGGDDVYRSLVSGKAASAPPPEATPSTLLRVFTNPSLGQGFVYDGSEGRLRVVPAHEGQAISALFYKELREIAERFVAVLEGDERTQLVAVLELEDYWRAWNGAINEPGFETIKDQWVAFRRGEIERRLRERFQAHDVPASVANEMLDQAWQGPKQKSQTRETPPTPPSGTPRLGGSAHLETPLREAVKRAVDRMSEQDLRQLWLPAGALYDALRTRR